MTRSFGWPCILLLAGLLLGPVMPPGRPAAAAVRPPKHGLRGSYYQNADLTALALTRVDPTVDFDWGEAGPTEDISPDSFSVRWEGQVVAPANGTFTFFTQTDDGVRLWVNDQQLIDEWVNEAVTEWSGQIALKKGHKYPIVMEYYENTSAAIARLLWTGPRTPKAIIPTKALIPPRN